jgi:photosystem II stability/assembly factor-like uncharacterized protein
MSWSSRFAERPVRRGAILAAAAAMGIATVRTAGAQQIRESENHARDRERYFYEERAYPFARIPAGALNAAKVQLELRFGSNVRRSVLGASQADATWVEIGPGTINARDAGRVTALALHPVDRQTIYAGGAQGGVWKTTNGGTSWTALGQGECSLAIGSIALDPVNPEIVYVATGEQNNSGDSYYGCGILRSTNGGATWTQLGASTFVTPFAGNTTASGARFGNIAVDPRGAGGATATVLVAANTGVFRSTNSGQSWTSTFTGHVSSLVLDPSNPNVVYIAVDDFRTAGSAAAWVYKSLDNGVTWTQLPLAIPAGTVVGRIDLAISRSQPLTLYAAVEDRVAGTATPGAFHSLWRTLDGGASWERRTATGFSCNDQCWYDLEVAVDPGNPDRVFVGGVSLYRTENGGTSFTNASGGIHVDHHAFVFDPSDPNTAYAGSDGGVYRTNNAGAPTGITWTTLNTNIAITQFYAGVSLHPTNPLNVIGGTQDNGTLEFIGTASWRSILGADGGFTAINPQNPNIQWAETQWSQGTLGGPRRRSSVPGAFQLRMSGIDINDNAQFIPPFILDPDRPATLYFGTTKLYRTVDDGISWTAVNPQVGRVASATTTAIAIAPSDSQTVFVGSTDGTVQVTTDYALTWSQRITGLPNRVIKDFAIRSDDAQHAWVVVSGFGSGHVFRTTNAGLSWQDVSGNLPNVPVNAVVVLPRSSEVFVGTDLGVFRSTTGGTTWVPFMEGFPNVAVFDLAFNDRTRILVAGTHGRGMFSYSLPPEVLRGDVNGDGRVTAADAQIVLTAAVGLPVPAGMFPYPNGDANCDGATTALDAQIILSFVVGAPTTQFCVGTIR